MITLHGQPIAREAFLWNGEVILEPYEAESRRRRLWKSFATVAARVEGRLRTEGGLRR